MRRARITYEGALHHGMNRGIDGNDIFTGRKSKAIFLELMTEAARKFKVRILAYTIMDNHYHLILENSSGRMSDFFRLLNGNYGLIYRKFSGEKGYVFQGRYKSTLIDLEGYLRIAIRYALLNPVRAGIVSTYNHYLWSSANEYFSDKSTDIVDHQFVNDLFSSKDDFIEFMTSDQMVELIPRHTKYGEVLGSNEFEKLAKEKFDRRAKGLSLGWKRAEDQDPIFNPVEKVIWEFERRFGQKIEELNLSTHEGKRLRGELLVRLKDIAGLKYSEIINITPFTNLKFPSLGKLYKDASIRRKGNSFSIEKKVKK
jgi:REP element-mobilizing transposase RayT